MMKFNLQIIDYLPKNVQFLLIVIALLLFAINLIYSVPKTFIYWAVSPCFPIVLLSKLHLSLCFVKSNAFVSSKLQFPRLPTKYIIFTIKTLTKLFGEIIKENLICYHISFNYIYIFVNARYLFIIFCIKKAYCSP